MPSVESRHRMAMFSGALALLIWVHNYIDTSEGVLGLGLQVVSLFTVGEIGFFLLPYFLFAYSASLISTKSSWGSYFFAFVLTFISAQQLLFRFDTSYHTKVLSSLGHIGINIYAFSEFLFGHIGSVVLLAALLTIGLSMLFSFPVMSIFKPLKVFTYIPVAFYKITRYEIQKAAPVKRFLVKLIYAMFFRRKEEEIVIERNEPDYDTRIFDIPAKSTDKKPLIKAEPVASLEEAKQKQIAEKQASADTSDIYTLDNAFAKEAEITDVKASDGFALDVDVSEPEPKKADPVSKSSTAEPVDIHIDTQEIDDEHYVLPPLDLLKLPSKKSASTAAITKQRVEKAAILEETLSSFNVAAKVVNITSGPSVTRYELQPGEGVKIVKITSLAKDIALKLAAPDVRIEAPIPGKSLVGIEVPNTDVEMITLRSIMESQHMPKGAKLAAVLGKTINGESVVTDIAKMPHLLIAGATGSGKSVCINAIILSILMKAKPNEVKLLMIDPKKVELSLYDGIPHLLAPVVTDPNKAAATLKKWALVEMEKRYEQFSAVGVKDIKGYNNYVKKELKKNPDAQIPDTELPLTEIPYVMVIIDELADLMMVAAQDVESTICRLAQMARATGIHLVIATQRPSVNVITGLIKANVPSRISFYLQSQIDSRTILDMPGAEKLLGKGDMLYSPVGSFNPTRVQGVFVSENEVNSVVSWLKKQGSPDYLNEIIEVEPIENSSDKSKDSGKDELFEDAKELIINSKYASTSYLQRKLRIGYNRAARIMDELEEAGVISEYVGDRKSRSVP